MGVTGKLVTLICHQLTSIARAEPPVGTVALCKSFSPQFLKVAPLDLVEKIDIGTTGIAPTPKGDASMIIFYILYT